MKDEPEIPTELMGPEPVPWVPTRQLVWPPQPRPLRSLIVAIGLFTVTAFSTLAAGAQFAAAYAANESPGFDRFFTDYFRPFAEPRLFVSGISFALTLMGILLAHELGHFFACRHYGINATYPYFIPAPTLIGTLGAFIRIRSPIFNRRALFDMALAGPLVGFLIAVPALAVAILFSKVIPSSDTSSSLVFGQPLIERMLELVLRPGVPHSHLLLHPVGRAAWVGLFATALNLLPAGQLDGGHILYAVASERHRRVSFAVAVLLVPLAVKFWAGWLVWAVLLVAIGFRHPPLIDRREPLGQTRRILSGVALGVFILCFMPAPFVL